MHQVIFITRLSVHAYSCILNIAAFSRTHAPTQRHVLGTNHALIKCRVTPHTPHDTACNLHPALSKRLFPSLSNFLIRLSMSVSPMTWPCMIPDQQPSSELRINHTAALSIYIGLCTPRLGISGQELTMEAKPALSSLRSRKPLPSESRQQNTFSMDAENCAPTSRK